LTSFKSLALRTSIRIEKRKEPEKRLDSLSINYEIALEMIMNLTVEDYSEGPKDDKDQLHDGTVWIFGKEVNDKIAYIKLKIDIKKDQEIPKCLAFHEAEFPIKFPLKKDGD
jgi:hypothetical protein